MPTGEEIDKDFYNMLPNFRQDMRALLIAYKMGIKFRQAQKKIEDADEKAYDKESFMA